MENKQRTLLLVDDEVNILNSLKRLLRREGYAITTFETGAEALEWLKDNKVQVVISDQRMPHMTGVELLQQIKDLSPETIRVVLSGYAEAACIVESINKGEVYRFLTKPWNDEELKTNIRQCFEHYELLQENRSLVGEVEKRNKELHSMNERLEEMVEARTAILKMSQEILECVPLAVMGVDNQKRVVITNQTLRQEFTAFTNFIPGSNLSEALPKEAVLEVERSFDERCDLGPFNFKWDSESVVLKTNLLISHTELRGCVVSLSRLRSKSLSA